jgi:hypothetical protein
MAAMARKTIRFSGMHFIGILSISGAMRVPILPGN